MAFFKKEEDIIGSDSQLSGILSEDCSFEGILVFEGMLRIDGRLTGKIICRPNCSGTLVIGKSGHVEADLLIVDNLFVSGKLFVTGPLIVLDKADFHGNSRIEIQKNYALYASRLVVKNQSLFQGKSVMIRHEPKETKDQIKNLIFENKSEIVNIPFKSNPLLKRIAKN